MDISIIIPVYNAQNSIEGCVNSLIESILKLKEVEVEILLINDGSSDDSIQKLAYLQEKYPLYIRAINQINQGVVKTRNTGIEIAKGEYLCFIDNDDYVDSDYLETFFTAIKATQADLVIGGYRRVSDVKTLFCVESFNSQWFSYMNVAPWAKIYRKQFIIDQHICFIESNIGEDILFNFQIYNKTKNIKIIPYTGYNWYYNDLSISNSTQKSFNPEVDIPTFLDKLASITKTNEPLMEKFLVRYVVWYLLFSGHNANSKDFMKEYEKDFSWLRKHHIPINFPLFSSEVNGETLKNRLIINCFLIIHRLHLTSLFSKLYCHS